MASSGTPRSSTPRFGSTRPDTTWSDTTWSDTVRFRLVHQGAPRRGVIRILLVTFLILLLSAAMMRTSPGDTHAMATPWRSFEVLLVPEGQDLQEVRERLLAAGKPPLDRYTATVEVEDFFKKSQVPVAELATRFDTGDPRFDPFMRALPDLFRGSLDGEPLELVFLPSGDSSPRGSQEAGDSGEGGERLRGHRFEEHRSREDRFRARKEIMDVLEGLPVEIAGAGRAPSPLAGLPSVLVSLAALVFVRRRWWPVVLAGGVTVLHGLGAGPVEEAGAVLLFLAWTVWQDRAFPREEEWFYYGVSPVRDGAFLRLSLAAILAGLIATAVTLGRYRAAGAGVSFLLFFFALGFVWLLAFFVGAWRGARREHPVFIPRPILPGRGAPRGVALRVTAGGVILLALAVPLILPVLDGAGRFSPPTGSLLGNSLFAGQVRSPREGALVIPVPSQLPGGTEGISWGDSGNDQNLVWAWQVFALAQEFPPGEHPLSVAGYLAHRRYQQSLLYGGDFSVPEPGDRIEITRFTREGGRVLDFSETRLVFDQGWLEAQRVPPARSVYGLFTLEGPQTVIAPRELTLRPVPHDRAGWAFLAFLAGLAVLVCGMRLPYGSRLGTVGLALRNPE